jgi:hypothetical protein
MPASENSERDAVYEAPELTDYGTIEAWTHGVRQLIQVSIVIN